MDCPTIVLTSRYGPEVAGGIETVVVRLRSEIKRRRPYWDVQHVFAFARVTPLSRVPFLTDLVSAGLMFARSRSASVVIINGSEYAWPWSLVPRFRDRALVVWHGTRVGEIPALAPRLSFPVRVYAFLELLLQRIATRIPRQIAVGPTVVDEIRAGVGYGGDVYIIPNGAPSVEITSLPRLAPKPLRLLWVGTVPYKKGLDLAVEGCRMARERGIDLVLTIAGVEKSGALKEEAWLKVIGRVDRERLASEYSSADAYLATTRYEGCSMACLEAMASGLPVIGSPVVRWMVQDGGVSFHEYSAKSVASAVCDFATDFEGRAAFQAKAASRAAEFTWSKAAEQYIQLIEQTIRTGS